jgi:hypothetical protein
MDDAKFERLRKAICRSFNSSPHKKKYWLAVLEMQLAPAGNDVSGPEGSQGVQRLPGNRRNRPHKGRVTGDK